VRNLRNMRVILVLFLMLLCLNACSTKPIVTKISSEPSGALIFLNNKMIGETPVEAIVPQRGGDYSIYTFRAVKEDYVPSQKMFKEQLYYEKNAEVIPADIHFVLRKRIRYPIHMRSEPEGAVITLNGEVIGETPFTAVIKERIGNVRTFEFVAIREGYNMVKKVLKEFEPQENGVVFEFPESMHFDLEKKN
jgi:hypothetical protein